jgi:hypothetical protein
MSAVSQLLASGNGEGSAARGELKLVWGAKGIGEVIGKDSRQANHLLAKGAIKCARKVNGQYVAPYDGLRQEFCGGAGQPANISS